jgi:CRISPR/Cas system-associated exonuclease Cas4 (RecB family)
MELENEYEKLLRYLENQEKKPAKSAPVKKETKKEIASQQTKKLLEESTFEDFKDIPHIHPSKGSKSFSVSAFENMMRSKLIEDHKTSQSYERPYISCSELYNCLRQVYFARNRYQVDVKSQFRFSYLYLIQKVGNVIHGIFQDLYNFTEIEKTIVSERYKVKGRLDAIKEKSIYEIKSIDSDKFKGKYLKEHYFQGLIYSYILITEYDYEIDTITIIYVLRNLKTIHSFDIEINMDLARSFLERAPILLTALETNIVPECIGANEEKCKYCLYKEYCKKEGFRKIEPPFLRKKKVKEKERLAPKVKEAKFLL